MNFFRLELKKEDDVMLDDNTQCQFSLKNFKILYIVNSENCFYRRLALRRAKEVIVFTNSLFTSSLFAHWSSGLPMRVRLRLQISPTVLLMLGQLVTLTNIFGYCPSRTVCFDLAFHKSNS